MRAKPIAVLSVAAILLLGLLIREVHTAHSRQNASTRQTTASPSTQSFHAEAPPQYRSLIATQGQSWTGIAQSNKAGPYLSEAGVYVELPEDRWPRTAEGKRVVVTGKPVIRHDLPVFIMSDEPLPPGMSYGAGIPMPKGTDLYKASERTVIEDAHWQLVAE